jgi:tripartite-type tricarboxylate transporter receptor subunit TctC
MVTSSTHIITPLLMATPYDAVNDFAAVTTIDSSDYVLAMPDTLESLASPGMVPCSNTPEQFAALLRSDAIRFAELIKAATIKSG